MRIDQSAASGKNQFSDSERFSFALQAANIGTWDLDPKRNLVWWDERCRELHGFPGDVEVPLEQIIQCVHEEDRNRVRQAVNTALNPASGGNYTVEFRTTGAEDYKLRWVHSKGQAFFNEKGEPYRFSGIIQDITDLVNARQQLESSERHWRNLIDHSPSATAVFIGPTMQIQAVNQSMLAILNKDQSIIGKDLLEALPEFKDQPFMPFFQNVYDTGTAYYKPEGLVNIVIDGVLQEFWFNYAYNPLRNEKNEVYGIICSALDITDLVRARRQMEGQKSS